MAIVEIDSLEFPGVELFSSLTEKQLRHSYEKGSGVFIVESPKVIDRALIEGYEPLALLCEQRHVDGDAAEIISRCGDIPVYTGSRELLASLTGYVLTRGVLCAMRRPAERSVEEVCRDARRVVVIDGVVDATNVGAMFRSAAALGIDAVLMTRTSCDPLNRRAVRVSMGAVFSIPWTWLPHRCDGSHRQVGVYRRCCIACRASSCHRHGQRGRRTACRYHRRRRLCGAHPDGTRHRLAQCCRSCCRGFLAVEMRLFNRKWLTLQQNKYVERL